MKLLSLFSGIGAFEKALDYLQIKYDLVNYCEIDKYASKSYSLIHNVSEEMNLGDITKVDTTKLPNDIDLISYGFPCTDISLAGKQKGFFQENILIALRHLEFTDEEIKNLYVYISNEKPTDSQLFDKLYDEYLLYEDDINTLLLLGLNKLTRSGLFFEALRIIEATKPKVAIAENVKNLTSKKFKTEFGIVLSSLEQVGYNNYWKVLNAKDYGIPQNRERVFIVSIRKDLDDGSFNFPKPYELELRLKDMLEDKVDEKYYLSDKMIKYISFTGTKSFKNPDCKINLDIARPLTTDQGKRAGTTNYICKELPDNFDLQGINKVIIEATLEGGPWERIHKSCGKIYDKNGIAPTLDTMQGGYRQPKIIVVGKTKSGGERSAILDEEGICSCLTATDYKQPKQILVREATKKGYQEAEEGDSVNLAYPKSDTRRGRVGKQISQTLQCNDNMGVVVAAAQRKRENGQQIEVSDREYANAITTVQKDSMVAFKDEDLVIGSTQKHAYVGSTNGVCPTLTEAMGKGGGHVPMVKYYKTLRIRKLTPKECWRLMGFEDEEIDKCIVGGLSNTQLYKQAGNSIVVDVLEEIFVELFKTGVLKDVR